MATEEFVEEPRRPNAAEVAWRALSLTSVIMRGQIESSLAAGDDTVAARKAAARLGTFIDAVDLRRWYSQSEADSIRKPLGSWSEQLIIDAHWRFESAAMLAWAIGLIESVPDYDTTIDVTVLRDGIPLLADVQAVQDFVRSAKLRDSETIDTARDIAESWHWRARTHVLSTGKFASDTPASEFLEYASDSAQCAEAQGWFTPIDGDFPVFGKAYRDVTDDEWQHLSSIACERHYAMNWLCGDASDWDEITTDK